MLRAAVGPQLAGEGEPVDRELLGAELFPEAGKVLATDCPALADHLLEDADTNADVVLGGPVVPPPLGIRSNALNLPL
eukprot:1453481-Alexandrium_andersonii.AAC.1